MENSTTDSYLHKKFKKQLSIEAKFQKYDKEKENKEDVESLEEKKLTENNKNFKRNICIDNNEREPNQSTNQNSYILLNSNLFAKSSVSLESCLPNLQSTNTSISQHLVTLNKDQAEHIGPERCDTNIFNYTLKPSCSAVYNTSSILNSDYFKQDYTTNAEENPSSKHIIIEKTHSSDEPLDLKHEVQLLRNEDVDVRQEAPPSQDGRPSGGKYICTYCNLACSKPSVLQKHIRAHTNERPYPCVSCGFSFKTRSNLYKHCRSRTHANRVMGNRAQEINSNSSITTDKNTNNECTEVINLNKSVENTESDQVPQDIRYKPYKPRFHTAKQFYEKSTIEDKEQKQSMNNNELLSRQINEIISVNNSIMNPNDRYEHEVNSKKTFNTRELIQYYTVMNNNSEQQHKSDEPLNLTNKNRKRCMSELNEPTTQKSLIKELLLKNLYADANMQCPHCKMIFRTVTELELHKLRSCRGFTKPGAKYSRSSSVNVASILTQNKNAFDDIPYLQNTTFPLKSPGPFLGKTRLVESDKAKSFSFEDGFAETFSMPNQVSDRLSWCPLNLLQHEKDKKPPVKLFGGEVKITHSSGETKSFKIDNKDSENFGTDSSFDDYGAKLSESRVVKSTLGSGGTMLTNNKSNYHKQEIIGKSPDLIKNYENCLLSPSIDISSMNNIRFNFDKQSDNNHRTTEHKPKPPALNLCTTAENYYNPTKNSPCYSDTILDFGQKAVKLLTPNLKQPNIQVTGLSVPNKFIFNNISPQKKIDISQHHPIEDSSILQKNLLNIADKYQQNKIPLKPILIPQQNTSEILPVVPTTPKLQYNPVNLVVDGRVVRYVPGMPGPVVAAVEQNEKNYGTNILKVNRVNCNNTKNSQYNFTSTTSTPTEGLEALEKIKENKTSHNLYIQEKTVEPALKYPNNDFQIPESKVDNIISKPIELKCDPKPITSNKVTELKSPMPTNEVKKFARPNSLALKPTAVSLKQHHGLTPTMFNQILISPDTPRVSKKYVQQFLHGNYFSYLDLKCSTKPVYCTLNKTQPFYAPHFKKLSMYSEWRQQDNKTDKLYVSSYDSRQKPPKYTTAGKASADLIVHSSYKFIVAEVQSSKTDKFEDKQSPILGGYECNEDYTYIRGRGRGRYVCDQCGIRCKKPSMLKKHIRTHSNDRPYTCNHCNFSFKTKGNLTKHMKSKAHTKNYTASNSSSSTQLSGTQSSDSDTEDSGMDSSDESTRQQEHEAAYGLLSLSQKTTQNVSTVSSDAVTPSHVHHRYGQLPIGSLTVSDGPVHIMNNEEIVHVSKKNYAKNKILDEKNNISFSTPRNFCELSTTPEKSESTPKEDKNIAQFLGKVNLNRPLTYPYTSILIDDHNEKYQNIDESVVVDSPQSHTLEHPQLVEPEREMQYSPSQQPKSIGQFHVIQKYANNALPISPKMPENVPLSPIQQTVVREVTSEIVKNYYNDNKILKENSNNESTTSQVILPILKVNDMVVINEIHSTTGEKRKRKVEFDDYYNNKIYKNDEVMDLTVEKKQRKLDPVISDLPVNNITEPKITPHTDDYQTEINCTKEEPSKKNNGVILTVNKFEYERNNVNVNYVVHEQQPTIASEAPNKPLINSSNNRDREYDNSAMETLAEIATKQDKLEKNTLAKSVASAYLELARKNESNNMGCDNLRDCSNFPTTNKEVNELIVKPEGSKSCTICSKSFSKPSQLRLHMNIHYLERPFRCDSCSVSFRTKGHLQKHERSAGHHNKLSTSPALSSSEPRPFKCSDCSIAFRIHGHLAKHLRSKLHIMKLECLAKIPFGLYAELERSNSLLTEINTADGDQCLESLKTLAKKVFLNDPSKLNQLEIKEFVDADS